MRYFESIFGSHSLDLEALKIVSLNFCNFFIGGGCERIKGRAVMRRFTFLGGGCYLNAMGGFFWLLF